MRRQQRSIDCCAVKNVTRLAERVNKMVLHWTFIASSASLPFHAPFKGKGGGEGARRRGEGGGSWGRGRLENFRWRFQGCHVAIIICTVPRLSSCCVCVQCCFTSTETVRTIYYVQGAQNVHLDFHTAAELCSVSLSQRCFTSSETIRTIRDEDPRTSTSTFTQALSSVQFNVALRPQKP